MPCAAARFPRHAGGVHSKLLEPQCAAGQWATVSLPNACAAHCRCRTAFWAHAWQIYGIRAVFPAHGNSRPYRLLAAWKGLHAVGHPPRIALTARVRAQRHPAVHILCASCPRRGNVAVPREWRRASFPARSLSVSAETFWVPGRGNGKEAASALKNAVFRRKTLPSPPYTPLGVPKTRKGFRQPAPSMGLLTARAMGCIPSPHARAGNVRAGVEPMHTYTTPRHAPGKDTIWTKRHASAPFAGANRRSARSCARKSCAGAHPACWHWPGMGATPTPCP